MLHLTVVAGDAACVTHRADGHHAAKAGAAHAMSVSGHSMQMTEDASASVLSASPGAKSGAPPCEVPTQPRCCQALVGCSVDGAVSSARVVLATTVSPAARICVAPDDVPASFAPAPELPPPKA